MQKGIFVVLDGNDGSGKATQSAMLASHFAAAGHPHQKFDFPAYGRSFFGTFLGECLAGQHGDFLNLSPRIASTLYAADRHEASDAIRDALVEGKVVIADRFASSNQIHQGGKIADERERIEFLGWLDRMEHEVLNVPRPDAIIYLSVPVETSLRLLTEKRAAKNQTLGDGIRDMVEEDRQYLERSHTTASWLANRENNWYVVECMEEGGLRTPEAIHADVRAIVEKLTARV